MKGCIEDCDLRYILPEQRARRNYAFDVVRIVKRCEIDAVFNAFEDTIIDQRGFLEQLATVYHTMPDCVHVGSALDFGNPGLVRSNIADDVIECRTHVAQRRCNRSSRVVAVADPDNGFPADSLYFSSAKAIVFRKLNFLEVTSDNLELHTGTSRVQNEHIHGEYYLTCRSQ